VNVPLMFKSNGDTWLVVAPKPVTTPLLRTDSAGAVTVSTIRVAPATVNPTGDVSVPLTDKEPPTVNDRDAEELKVKLAVMDRLAELVIVNVLWQFTATPAAMTALVPLPSMSKASGNAWLLCPGCPSGVVPVPPLPAVMINVPVAFAGFRRYTVPGPALAVSPGA
jgi:hypothetical protein